MISDSPGHPSFLQAFRFWFKLGWISFGGPTGQIAIMHQELVEKRRWISEERFLHALNYCMLLPGPEAQQLAIYIGWLLHRAWGGIVAGAFFVIPSIFILTSLSWVYMAYGKIPVIASLFYGLKAAVLAIVAAAVIRIGQKVLKNGAMITLAAAAFVGIFFLKIPFPLIILGAGLIGLAGGRMAPKHFLVVKGHGASSSSGSGAVLDTHHETPDHAHPTLVHTLKVLGLCLPLWFLPLIALSLRRGSEDVFFRMGIFFSKAAMVTFGGAYAVLPYVAQECVKTYGWLTGAQMMDGLGLAETTPGPLIMVVNFVGFVGAWQHAGGLPPWLAGVFGGLVATYFTFLPCFLWIFLGAPYVEKLRGNVQLTSALSAITAAVVGVVLNLAVFFGGHVLKPEGRGFDFAALMLAAIAFFGMRKWNWDIVWVALGAAFAGLLLHIGHLIPI
ncbi:MAG TPA: chromate efflux transporter [bacterium]|nr:chromate efflux transporter [bacterium]